MKSLIPLCAAVALLESGCHHPHIPAVAAQSAPLQPVHLEKSPPAPPLAANSYPPETEEYYVGMIPDPEDSRFAYHPGTLVVERRSERLRLGGDEVQVVPAFHRGPVTTARLADDHPAYTTAELASLAVRSQQLITFLSEENEHLRAGLAHPDKSTPDTPHHPGTPEPDVTGPSASVPDRSAKKSPERTAPLAAKPLEELNLVRPNAENVIELDPALFASPATLDNNPFVQVYQPAVQLREITLVVSAAVPGPSPSAVINDVPYGLHSQFQGMEIHRIDPDTVYLRKESFLLACPVSEKPLRLRLP
jgi:hypothetical protein